MMGSEGAATAGTQSAGLSVLGLMSNLRDFLQHFLRLQLLQSQQRQTQLVLLSERLSHLAQEVLGELDGLVHSEVETAVVDVLLNPPWKLPSFVCSSVSLVGEDHEAVVRLASDGSAHALSCVPHGVERQEVVLSDLKLIPKILQPSLQDAALSVDVRDPKHDDRSTKMMHKIYAFRHLPSGHGEEDGSSAVLTQIGRAHV